MIKGGLYSGGSGEGMDGTSTSLHHHSRYDAIEGPEESTVNN